MARLLTQASFGLARAANWDDVCAFPQTVEVVRPRLHHFSTFRQPLCFVIRRTNRIPHRPRPSTRLSTLRTSPAVILYRVCAQIGKDESLQRPYCFGESSIREAILLQRQPFAGHGFEGVIARSFFCLPAPTWVQALSQEFPRLFAFLARQFSARIGIAPEPKHLMDVYGRSWKRGWCRKEDSNP
jgi:hypothetical protein